jgi:DNA-binding transcriptional LysR family regulator
MKLSQCAALVAVVDSGSFTKAARQLGISQSAVSHAVGGLEAELGCPLLDRDRSGVRLTGAGRGILAHARDMLGHAEQIRQEVREARTGQHGAIRFATSQSFATRLLPALLRGFRARLPGQEVEVREGTDQQIALWLRRRVVHVGVVTLPKSDLNTVPLWQDDMFAVVPAEHPLAEARVVDATRLAEEPLLMPIGGVEPMVRSALRLAGVEPAVSYRMRDLNALLAMVAEGLGVTVLPALALPPSAARGTSIVPFVPTVTRRVALGVPEPTGRSSALALFVGMARELVTGGYRSPLSSTGTLRAPAPARGQDAGAVHRVPAPSG